MFRRCLFDRFPQNICIRFRSSRKINTSMSLLQLSVPAAMDFINHFLTNPEWERQLGVSNAVSEIKQGVDFGWTYGSQLGPRFHLGKLLSRPPSPQIIAPPTHEHPNQQAPLPALKGKEDRHQNTQWDYRETESRGESHHWHYFSLYYSRLLLNLRPVRKPSLCWGRG